MAALTFWHVAGDIIWRGDGRCAPIERFQAESLRELYEEEARCADDAGDEPTSIRADALWGEIHRALKAHDQWRKAFAGPAMRRVA